MLDGKRLQCFCGTMICGIVLWLPSLCPAADEPSDLAQYYGFSGVEIYELHERAAELVSGDFNADGHTDLAVVDNFTSSLKLFLQRSELPEQKSAAEVNRILSDQRFQTRSISLDRSVADLVAADLNNDGRPDLAVFGVPDQVAVYLQPVAGQSEWKKEFAIRLPEVEPTAGILTAGDLNSDGLTDLAVLGSDSIRILHQQQGGGFGSPVQLMNSLQRPAFLKAADLNGDGRDDLSYVAGGSGDRMICARLQTAAGQAGPEIVISDEQVSALTLAEIDGQPGLELLTVDARTRRVRISALEIPEQRADQIPQLVRYGLGDSGAARDRGVLTADFDGDGGVDILATNPEQAEMLLYRQAGRGGPGLAASYPALLGVSDVAAADLDGDGRPEAILLSSKEKVIAVSSFRDGRMSFPETIIQQPADWELAALAVALDSERPQLIVGITQGSGRSGKLRFLRYDQLQDGTWSESDAVVGEELTGAIGQRGVRLLSMDVNGDGRADLLSIASGTATDGFHVLVSNAAGGFDLAAQKNELDAGVAGPGRVFVDGTRLLVARDSFARLLEWEANGWRVRDQFNAAESGSDVTGVAVLDLDGSGEPEIVLVDTGVNRLRILRQQDSVYRLWQDTELGELAVTSTATADLNGDGRPDLLLVGRQQMAVLFAGSSGPRLQERGVFEADRERFFPVDVLAGDINGDGNADLTVIDNSINGLALLAVDPQMQIREATHFRVFEEKRLVSSEQRGEVQPREGLIIDVTGDGLADVVLLCHDRLLVYPQDSGQPAAAISTQQPVQR